MNKTSFSFAFSNPSHTHKTIKVNTPKKKKKKCLPTHPSISSAAHTRSETVQKSHMTNVQKCSTTFFSQKLEKLVKEFLFSSFIAVFFIFRLLHLRRNYDCKTARRKLIWHATYASVEVMFSLTNTVIHTHTHTCAMLFSTVLNVVHFFFFFTIIIPPFDIFIIFSISYAPGKTFCFHNQRVFV